MPGVCLTKAMISPEQLNLYKFVLLVLDVFPKVLRQIFITMWNSKVAVKSGFIPWDDSDTVRNMLLKSEGGKTDIPTTKSIEEWDCTALLKATIYAKTFGVPSSKGSTLNDSYLKKVKPLPGPFHPSVQSSTANQDETYALASDQMRLLRNTLFHSPNSELTKTDFDNYVQLVKNISTAVNFDTTSVDIILQMSEGDFSTTKVQELNERVLKLQVTKMNRVYKCIRYLMIVFNLVFCLCGIAGLVVGIIVRVDREDRLLYLEVCDKFDYHSVSYISIASALFIIIVSAIGFFGTLKESRSFLLSFICCLFLLFVIALTITVFAFVHRTEVEDELKGCMNGALVEYYADEKMKTSWDKIQLKLSCCGVLGGNDYARARNRPFNVTSPKTCDSNTYDKGCYARVKDHLALLVVILLFIMTVEFIGMLFSFWMVWKITDVHYARMIRIT